MVAEQEIIVNAGVPVAQATTEVVNQGFNFINFLNLTSFYTPYVIILIVFALSFFGVSFKFYKRRVANFFNKKGEFIGKCSFSIKDKKFNYSKGTYNIDPDASFTKSSNLICEVYDYYYTINSPDPIYIGIGTKGNGFSEKLTPETYKAILDADFIKKINALANTGWSDVFTMKNLLIGGAVLLALWYFASGGKIW